MSDAPGRDIVSTAPPAAAPGGGVGDGLHFLPAATLDEVIACWRLVFTAYRRKGLIEPNPYRIHTSRSAVGPQSLVISGRIGPVIATTLTAIGDSDAGLPLDRVFPLELRRIRGQGRRLIEVGLFADRRANLSRSAEALLQLMRYIWHWGRAQDVTDFVIGVHPRHGRFYSRAFGFHEVSDVRTYPAVNNHPVVLLRGEPAVELARNPPPRGLVHFEQSPVEPAAFATRYLFPDVEVSNSLVGQFLMSQAAKYDESAA